MFHVLSVLVDPHPKMLFVSDALLVVVLLVFNLEDSLLRLQAFFITGAFALQELRFKYGVGPRLTENDGAFVRLFGRCIRDSLHIVT